MSTPAQTWEQRAEAFRRGLSEIDQAGDMLAVERARAKRWKAAAKRIRERSALRAAMWAHDLEAQVWELTRERDEARAALLRRMGRDDKSGA